MHHKDTYHVAIIGSGFNAGTAHIPVYMNLGSKVEIVAVADNREEAAAHAAKIFGISRYYTDPQQMLDEYKVELLERIEEARHELQQLADLYGYTAPLVVLQSQRLDGLLNSYDQIKEGKAHNTFIFIFR